MASEARPKILSGLLCPSVAEVSLEFLLTSDKLGEASEILSVPIEQPQEQVETETIDSE